MHLARFTIIAFALVLSLSSRAMAMESSSASPSQPVGPTPVERGTWILPSDYPTGLLKDRPSGTTQVVLGVLLDGAVTSCSVESSSGSVILDDTTCNLLKIRAKFLPAKDGYGRPRLSDYRQKVMWQAPEIAKPVRIQTVNVLEVGKDGIVTRCYLTDPLPQTQDLKKVEELACKYFPAGSRQAIMAGPNGKPVPYRMIFSPGSFKFESMDGKPLLAPSR
jgi:hypothetical protein